MAQDQPDHDALQRLKLQEQQQQEQQRVQPGMGQMQAQAPSFVPSMTAPAFVPGQAFTPGAYTGAYGNPYNAYGNAYANPYAGAYGQPAYGQPAAYGQAYPTSYFQPPVAATPPAPSLSNNTGPAVVRRLGDPAPSQPAVVKRLGDSTTSNTPAVVKRLGGDPVPASSAAAPAPVTKSASVKSLDKEIKAVSTESVKQETKTESVPVIAPASTTAAVPVPVALPPLPVGEWKAPVVELDADHKQNLNVVFIGHVDAGKSTMGGHLLVLTGMVDKRTLEKYEREAKEAGRDTWYLSYALDLNAEERAKGKTVECGRAWFSTQRRHFTILDAPGHKGFVSNMIDGAVEADVAVLVISARRGEFETGFDRGGQTREHVMLVKTIGVKRLIIAVNKMDDPTVMWSQERYDEIVNKIVPFCKTCGFNPKTDIEVIPVSGYTGSNLKDRLTADVCTWHSGPSLLEFLDAMPLDERKVQAPFLMPISDKQKDMGLTVAGKIETGMIRKGLSLLVMPNRQMCEVSAVILDELEVKGAMAGDNVRLKLRNIEEDSLAVGFVLCDPLMPCRVATSFIGQIHIKEHKNILCAGYQAVMHVQHCHEEVIVADLLHLIDKKTGKRHAKKPMFAKQDQVVDVRIDIVSGSLCLEPFTACPPLGRFSLRNEGITIAVGKVLKVLTTEVVAPVATEMPPSNPTPLEANNASA